MIKELTKKYICNTYNKKDVVFVSGKGATLQSDTNDKYIDFGSGIGINALGINNKKWQKAIYSQLIKLGHTSNLYYTEPAALLAEKLCKITGFKKVFFANSGAESNECAIKAARKYSFDKYGKNRYEIISLTNSFHGRTLATLSLTGQETFHQTYMPFLKGFKYVNINDKKILENAVNKKTCAIYLELIQGEGGVNVLDKDYVKFIRKLCFEKDILMIIDEVQTGNGRTGKKYAYEYFDIEPDIMTTAKGLGNGLPISCVMFNEKTMGILTPGAHGCTFGGNPIICAGSLVLLDYLTDDFLDEVVKKGEYIKQKLLKIDGVINVTGLGLMIGVVVNAEVEKVIQKCFENHLLVLSAKGKIRLLPSLNITYKEIDDGLKKFKKSMEELINE